MAEIKWIKIVTDIFDDEKVLLIESMPDADSIIVIWFKLLCLAGKQNNSGVFIMSNGFAYTDVMLSTIFRRKETTVRMALEVFRKFGMIEIIEGALTIPNWGKYQSIDMLQDRRDYMKDYMRDYRERQRGRIPGGEEAGTSDEINGKVYSKANSKANVNLQEDKKKNKKKKRDNIYTAFFDSFWDAYPRRREKAKAYKCYQERIREGFREEDLIAAARAYADECETSKQEVKFIKYPSTFLGVNKPFEDYMQKSDNHSALQNVAADSGRVLE